MSVIVRPSQGKIDGQLPLGTAGFLFRVRKWVSEYHCFYQDHDDRRRRRRRRHRRPPPPPPPPHHHHHQYYGMTIIVLSLNSLSETQRIIKILQLLASYDPRFHHSPDFFSRALLREGLGGHRLLMIVPGVFWCPSVTLFTPMSWCKKLMKVHPKTINQITRWSDTSLQVNIPSCLELESQKLLTCEIWWCSYLWTWWEATLEYSESLRKSMCSNIEWTIS